MKKQRVILVDPNLTRPDPVLQSQNPTQIVIRVMQMTRVFRKCMDCSCNNTMVKRVPNIIPTGKWLNTRALMFDDIRVDKKEWIFI